MELKWNFSSSQEPEGFHSNICRGFISSQVFIMNFLVRLIVQVLLDTEWCIIEKLTNGMELAFFFYFFYQI